MLILHYTGCVLFCLLSRGAVRGAFSKGCAWHSHMNAFSLAMIQCQEVLGPAIATCRAGWGSPVVAHSVGHSLGSSWLVDESDPSIEKFHRLGSIDVVEIDATCCLQPNNQEQEPSWVASNSSFFYVCFHCSELAYAGWFHIGSTIITASCIALAYCVRHVTSWQKLYCVVLSRLNLAIPPLGRG